MPNTERLRKITEKPHGTGEFYFGAVYWETQCGTLACKMGDLPHQWPEDWVLDDELIPILRENSTGETSDDVQDYFDLTADQFFHLFYPNRQIYGRPRLLSTATEE